MPKLSGSRAASYSYAGAIAALLAAGVVIRSWGVLVQPLDFWADEAWWATLLESRGLAEFGFRPIAYMWVCRQLLELGSPEIMLRLPSWLAGIAALAFIYKSAELLFESRATVLVVLLLAVVHPHLAMFAKEFKPYSLEVFVYSALTFWALRCLRDNRFSAGLLIASLIAIPFCYPVVFLYPALLLAFAGERLAILQRLTPRQWIAVALVVIPSLFMLQVFLFESLDAAQSRWFWGSKYDVFPIGTGFFGGFAWYMQKSWSLLTLAGNIDGMPSAGLALFGLAALFGAGMLLASGRRREFALLCVPLMAAALANLLGYWPYGAFRANLFLIPGILLVAGKGFDRLATGRQTRYVAYGILAGIVFLAATADRASYRTKLSARWAAAPQLTEVLDEIVRRGVDERDHWTDIILADWHSWRPILYYLRDYPELKQRVRLVRGPLADTARLEAQLAEEVERARWVRRKTRLWLVVTQLKPHRDIRSSELVDELAVHLREFESPDRNYHPLLIELHF